MDINQVEKAKLNKLVFSYMLVVNIKEMLKFVIPHSPFVSCLKLKCCPPELLGVDIIPFRGWGWWCWWWWGW